LGGLNSYLCGGDFLQGFVMGAITGALGAGVGAVLENTALNAFGSQVVGGAIGGGIMGEISGEGFREGAVFGAVTSGLSWKLDKLIPTKKNIFKSKTPFKDLALNSMKRLVYGPLDPMDYIAGLFNDMFSWLFGSGEDVSEVEEVQPQRDEYILPTEGTVTSVYGKRTPPEWYDENGILQKGSDFHFGWDIANVQGTSVVSISEGQVVYAQKLDAKNGNVVIIRHNNGDYSYYFHVQNINVEKGQTVTKGFKIAEIGNIGTGPHLHFAMGRGNVLFRGYYNPIISLPGLADLPRKSGQIVVNNGQFLNVLK
ncbi:MAG: M23 family metallopeptidase, partial [Firmicutes bacterium]|nr:M23 family metallopeptidase [Bacillota bacterium]